MILENLRDGKDEMFKKSRRYGRYQKVMMEMKTGYEPGATQEQRASSIVDVRGQTAGGGDESERG